MLSVTSAIRCIHNRLFISSVTSTEPQGQNFHKADHKAHTHVAYRYVNASAGLLHSWAVVKQQTMHPLL